MLFENFTVETDDTAPPLLNCCICGSAALQWPKNGTRATTLEQIMKDAEEHRKICPNGSSPFYGM